MKTVLGTMTFGPRMDAAAAARAVAEFVAAGAGAGELDTAFMYGGGATETILGAVLAERGWDGITLATKAHPNAAQFRFADDKGTQRRKVQPDFQVTLNQHALRKRGSRELDCPFGRCRRVHFAG